MPNSAPSANCVDALCSTMALSTSARNRSAAAASSVMMQSVCCEPYCPMCAMAASRSSTTRTAMMASRYSLYQSCSSAGFDSRVGTRAQRIAAHLAARRQQRLHQRRQMRRAHVAIDQQRLRRAAHAGAAHFRIQHDTFRHRQICIAMHIHVANAFEVPDHRHARFLAHARNQIFSAARHDDIDAVGHVAEHMAHGGAIGWWAPVGCRLGGSCAAIESLPQTVVDGGTRSRAFRTAAQDHRISGLQAQRAGIGGDIGPALVNDADDAQTVRRLSESACHSAASIPPSARRWDRARPRSPSARAPWSRRANRRGAVDRAAPPTVPAPIRAYPRHWRPGWRRASGAAPMPRRASARFFWSPEANASCLAASPGGLRRCLASNRRRWSQDSQQHQIITVHDLFAAPKTQHLLDIGGLAADDPRGVGIRISADSSADLSAVRADDADGVAAIESADARASRRRAEGSSRPSAHEPRPRRRRSRPRASMCPRSIVCGWPAASRSAQTRCSELPPRCAAADAPPIPRKCTDGIRRPRQSSPPRFLYACPPNPCRCPSRRPWPRWRA